VRNRSSIGGGIHADIVELQDSARLVEQSHHHGFAVLGRHGRHAHVDLGATHLDIEAPVLRQSFLGDVESRHQFKLEHQGGRNLGVGLGLDVKHTVDPEPDLQRLLHRLDVNVGRAHLHRILEHCLQQLDHRRVFHPRRERNTAQVDDRFAKLGAQFLRQSADFLGAPVDAVDGLQQQRFAHHGKLDLALEHASQFVIGEQVGRVGHADAEGAAGVLQNQRPEAACQRFRQPHGHFGLDVEMLEVDERDLKLTRERAADLVLGEIAAVDEDAAEFSAAALLLGKRGLELLLRQQPLLQQDLSQADLFGFPHPEIYFK